MENRQNRPLQALGQRLIAITKAYRKSWQKRLRAARTSFRAVSKKIQWRCALTGKGVYSLSALLMAIITIAGLYYLIAGSNILVDGAADEELHKLSRLAGASLPLADENDDVGELTANPEGEAPVVPASGPVDWKEVGGEEVVETPVSGESPKGPYREPTAAAVAKEGLSPAGDLIAPLAAPVSSPFGWRQHPVLGDWRFHTGVDFPAPLGTTFQTALSGEVQAVYSDSLLGSVLVILHGQGWETRYGNCGEIQVETGQFVLQGEELAKVGDTGIVKEPHLHFELRRDGLALDPLEYLPPYDPVVNGEE